MLEVEYLSASGRCFNAKRVADSASSPRAITFSWRSIRPKDDQGGLISPRSVVQRPIRVGARKVLDRRSGWLRKPYLMRQDEYPLKAVVG